MCYVCHAYEEYNYKNFNSVSTILHFRWINKLVQGSNRKLIIKFPDFSMIFQRYKVKFPDHGCPTNRTSAINEVGDQTPLKDI